ncbi:hypothetical protein FNH22_11025 [Fulvivirga sp. M361]|uniref:tetratricopeptide repeat protein n=1 Tax=Fulvivirga sp. M361 TaxID=2594266 RepID=UPI00117AEF3C|nr:hypothetical protein [Fulvivirga sp. M361]TRX59052.1 hypothetical protein FNH22_11025 [Fulvivirga sp. M361]
MALTLADQYYLKALDDYDYDLEAVVENLNYALSYDKEHAGANYLMGRLYMEQFGKFDLAEEYFTASMASEPENINTCKSFAWLLIRTQKFKEALKLVKYASGLKGATIPEFMRLEALIYELLKDFARSREILNEAMLESYDSNFISFLRNELHRVEDKMKRYTNIDYYIVN